MWHEIVLAPQAVQALLRLHARDRTAVRDAMEVHLRHQPTKTSRGRIKRLRKVSHPEYRLRVGGIRVFFDVTEGRVEILAIVPKSGANEWLKTLGEQP